MKPRRIQRFVLAQVFGPPSPKRADSLAPLRSSWRNQRRKALPQMWAGEDPRPLPAQPPLSGRGSSWCRECPNAATRDYLPLVTIGPVDGKKRKQLPRRDTSASSSRSLATNVSQRRPVLAA